MAGRFSWQSVRPRGHGEALGLAAAAAAGAAWLRQRLLGYPPGYFLPVDSVWPVTAATLLALVAFGLFLALAFAAPVLALRRPAAGDSPRAGVIGPAILVVALSVALRGAFWRELPGAPWTDGVHALHDAASAGRFLWPWEAVSLAPAPFGPSNILLFGGMLDVARVLLVLAPDRQLAYALLSALPGALIPLALFLLTRRLAPPRAALIAGVFAATAFPLLVQARWGWDQQMMVLLVVLSLERAAAARDSGRAGPLLACGLLAGLSLHTYVGSIPAVGALAVFLFGSFLLRRQARAFGAFAAGLALPALFLALVYVRRPDALGGRAAAIRLRGSPSEVAWSVAENAADYVGLLSFAWDRNTRHGEGDTPPFNAFVAALLPAGLAAAWSRERGLLLAVLAGSLAGGVLSSPLEAPNGYRAGLALALALPLAAAGLDALALRAPPSLARAALPLVVVVASGLCDTTRFLRWGLLSPTAPRFGQRAAAAGAFASSVGRQRVAVDPGILAREDSPFLVAFPVDATRPLSPLELLPMRAPDTGACAEFDWIVTSRPPRGLYTVRLGFPGTPEGSVFAARCGPSR